MRLFPPQHMLQPGLTVVGQRWDLLEGQASCSQVSIPRMGWLLKAAPLLVPSPSCSAVDKTQYPSFPSQGSSARHSGQQLKMSYNPLERPRDPRSHSKWQTRSQPPAARTPNTTPQETSLHHSAGPSKIKSPRQALWSPHCTLNPKAQAPWTTRLRGFTAPRRRNHTDRHILLLAGSLSGLGQLFIRLAFSFPSLKNGRIFHLWAVTQQTMQSQAHSHTAKRNHPLVSGR